VRLEHRNVHEKIGRQEIGIEGEGHAVPQVYIFEWPLLKVEHLHPVALVQRTVAERLEGVERGFPVLRVSGGQAFPDRDVVDAAFLEQDHRVLHQARRGDHTVLGEDRLARPENDVRLDEDLGPCRKRVEAPREVNGLPNRYEGFFVTNQRYGELACHLRKSPPCRQKENGTLNQSVPSTPR